MQSDFGREVLKAITRMERSIEVEKFIVSELRVCWIELKSLILAQIERWRHALHMQVERQHGATWWRVANG